MSVTWVLFSWYDDMWHYNGHTPHDEVASEFEERMENAARLPYRVISIEDPDPDEIKRYADLMQEDVEVKGELL